MNKVLRKNITAIAISLMTVISAIIIQNNQVYAANSNKVYKKSSITIKSAKQTEDGVKLKWKKDKNSYGYVIYRKEDNGKFEEYDQVIKKTTFIDECTDTGVEYQYAIKGFNYYRGKIIYTKLSKFNKTIIGVPDKVENVSAKFADNNVINIKWSINDEASGYNIYRNIDNEWELIKNIEDNEIHKYKDEVEIESVVSYKVIPYEYVDGILYEGYFKVSEKYAFSDNCIDVSYHNGKINWKKVKESGIDYAFIRIGYGSPDSKKYGVLDSRFDRNITKARKAGVKVGVYLYSYAESVSDAKKEAKFVLRKIKKYGELDLPIVYDFENMNRKRYSKKKANTKIIKAFCDAISSAGYEAMIYSDNNMLTKYVDTKKLSNYGLWVAYWTFDVNNYAVKLKNVKFWQYSDVGRISGIKEYTDRNVSFIKK